VEDAVPIMLYISVQMAIDFLFFLGSDSPTQIKKMWNYYEVLKCNSQGAHIE